MKYFAIALCIYFLFSCSKSRNEPNLVSKKIGNQTWAIENLSTTRYVNGIFFISKIKSLSILYLETKCGISEIN